MQWQGFEGGVEEIELSQLSAGEFPVVLFSPTPDQGPRIATVKGGYGKLAVSPVLPYENTFLRDYKGDDTVWSLVSRETKLSCSLSKQRGPCNCTQTLT